MEKKIVFMFSGQGSQYFQMGKKLYDGEPQFRQWMNELDELPKKTIGVSIVDEIYDKERKKEDCFGRTLLTHPAIFMTEYSMAMTIMNAGVRPDWVMGTSLGEFAAAVIAGVLDVGKALELVMLQAACIEDSCERGGMLAILANQELYGNVSLIRENSSLVGMNFPTHFVISGFEKQIKEIEKWLKENCIPFQPLSVSHGFHSPNIDPGRERFLAQINHEIFRSPQIGFISANKGRPLQKIDERYFWNIVREPILFRETATSMFCNEGFHVIIDLSPSGTLAALSRHILSQNAKIMYSMTPYGDEKENMNLIKKMKKNIDIS
jgi:trans-AT polyketide synthase, acyltransferase and oxidoreductase domains